MKKIEEKINPLIKTCFFPYLSAITEKYPSESLGRQNRENISPISIGLALRAFENNGINISRKPKEKKTKKENTDNFIKFLFLINSTISPLSILSLITTSLAESTNPLPFLSFRDKEIINANPENREIDRNI